MPSTFQSPLLQQLLPSSQSLEGRLQQLESWMRRSQSADINFTSLDQVSNDMGVFQVGEIIAGTGTPEGGDLTGVAILSNPITISGRAYNIVGMSAGTLEFGLSADDGKAYFAAGTAVIDVDGITIIGDGTNRIIWKGSGGVLTIGDIFGMSITGTSGIALEGYGVNGRDGYAALIGYESNTITNYNSLAINTGSGLTADFTASSVKTANARAFVVKNEISTSSLNTLLYLDTYKNAAPSAGLGSAISFRSENSTPAITDLGYFGMRFNTVTAGNEDTEAVIAIKAGGASTEMLTVSQLGFNILNNANLRGNTFTLGTDAATSFTPTRIAGMLILAMAGGGNGGLIYYHTGTPACAIMVAGANIAATTGVLTGTTGAAGKFTVSAHTDGKIYIENRTGASKSLFLSLF